MTISGISAATAPTRGATEANDPAAIRARLPNVQPIIKAQDNLVIDGLVSSLSLEMNNVNEKNMANQVDVINQLQSTYGKSPSVILAQLDKELQGLNPLNPIELIKKQSISKSIQDLALQHETIMMLLDVVSQAMLRPVESMEDPELRDEDRAKSDYERLIERTPPEVILDWLRQADLESPISASDLQRIKA